MIRLKSPKEIEILAEGGKILAEVLQEIARAAKPGVTSMEVEELAQSLMVKFRVKSSFLGYEAGSHDPYPSVTCISINEGVVHGIPGNQKFAEGDLVGLDCGIIYKDMYLDAARTVGIGKVSPEAQKLMNVTREALRLGIEQARVGNRIGDIGAAVQAYAESFGYGVVTQLVGHGVGYDVHEEPKVPNFGQAGTGPVIEEGLVIAIEPMVTAGNPQVKTAKDGWTIETVDGSISAHEEHTVAVNKSGPKILTAL
ncbi:MAG: type I methionyl aminopeptidase [Patescibacteria group bacterium]